MRPETLIYLDVDRTVFDTEKFIFELTVRLTSYLAEKLSINKEELFTVIGQFLKDFFTQPISKTEHAAVLIATRLVTMLSLEEPLGLEIIDLINGTLADPALLFPEVREFGQQAKANGLTLGINSQGVEAWQRAKLAGMMPWLALEMIVIARDKLLPSVVTKLATGAWVVDDKLDHLLALKEQRPDLKLFWLDRSQAKSDQTVTKPTLGITRITSLLDLLAVPEEVSD